MPSSKAVENRFLLPKCIVPKHYNLFIEPDLAEYTYKGHVTIELEVNRPTKQVSLHAIDLVFAHITFSGMDAVNEKYDSDSQSVTWEFPNDLSSKGYLGINFTGILNNQMSGFYRSMHKDKEGNTRCIATTQMEPTYCRKAFPCFDEPALKATFDITIAADPALTVLSNSSVQTISARDDGKAETKFNRTPRMSTYLVAFVVGELRYVQADEFRVPVRVYTTPGLEKKGKFSAHLAARTLSFFEEKFGIKYPLPKCDLVGVHDFASGAMENWGLLTFRLITIMYDENKDSLVTKQDVALVVQHELAHQWFGNLVTMEWWEGLWLNEGFAVWMAYFATNHFFPEWDIWASFVAFITKPCLQIDGLRSSHPVDVPVSRADEVTQIFDQISYSKGACVIRMLSTYLGEDTFIRGISHYLKKHAYGITTTEDLWAALTEISGKEVGQVMNIWTKKQGYPVITVHTDGTVEQNRYLETADVRQEDDEVIYPVFLSIRMPDGSIDNNHLMKDRITALKGDWLKLNANQTGIYRVKYSGSHMDTLLSSDKLSVEDRIGLLSDLSALSGRYVSTTQLLNLLQHWVTEQSPVVFLAMDFELKRISRLLTYESEKLRHLFMSFRAYVTLPKLQELGMSFSSKDSAQEAELRGSLFQGAIKLEIPELIKFALQQFDQYSFGVNPNIQFPVFLAVARFGKDEQWYELFQHYLEGTNGFSGMVALLSLGTSSDLEKQQLIFESILSSEIRPQDAVVALKGIASQREGQMLLWNWLQKNWHGLREKYSASDKLFSGIINCAIDGFTTSQQLEEVEKFFSTKDLTGIDKIVKINTDRIKSAISLLQNDASKIEGWLSEFENLSGVHKPRYG